MMSRLAGEISPGGNQVTTSMTSRERVMPAFDHVEPDRTPIFEYVLQPPVADAILGRLYAIDEHHFRTMTHERGWETAVRQMAIDYLDLAETLGHDMLYVMPNPPPPQQHSNYQGKLIMIMK